MKTEFGVVSATGSHAVDTIKKVVTATNVSLEHGWKLRGELSIVHTLGGITVAQAMVKETREYR